MYKCSSSLRPDSQYFWVPQSPLRPLEACLSPSSKKEDACLIILCDCTAPAQRKYGTKILRLRSGWCRGRTSCSSQTPLRKLLAAPNGDSRVVCICRGQRVTNPMVCGSKPCGHSRLPATKRQAQRPPHTAPEKAGNTSYVAREETFTLRSAGDWIRGERGML